MPVPTPAPLSRRRFVAASAGVLGLLATAGCALPAPEEDPDPLLRLATAAERDARELAAADASHGPDAAGLRQVGEIRRVHAERLTAEIDRLADDPTDASGTPTAAPTRAPGNDGEVVCPPISEVRARMRSDARAAGDFAASSEGYRAELAAAVSAACTAALEVVLA